MKPANEVTPADVLAVLATGPATSYEIAKVLGVSSEWVSDALGKLKNRSKVRRTDEDGPANPGGRFRAKRWALCGG